MRHNNTYEGIYSYKDVLALPTRGAEIGCWKAVAETATDAATMIAVDFMVFSSKVLLHVCASECCSLEARRRIVSGRFCELVRCL